MFHVGGYLQKVIHKYLKTKFDRTTGSPIYFVVLRKADSLSTYLLAAKDNGKRN